MTNAEETNRIILAFLPLMLTWALYSYPTESFPLPILQNKVRCY